MGNLNEKLEQYVVEVPDEALPIILSELKKEQEQIMQDNLENMHYFQNGNSNNGYLSQNCPLLNNGSNGDLMIKLGLKSPRFPTTLFNNSGKKRSDSPVTPTTPVDSILQLNESGSSHTRSRSFLGNNGSQTSCSPSSNIIDLSSEIKNNSFNLDNDDGTDEASDIRTETPSTARKSRRFSISLRLKGTTSPESNSPIITDGSVSSRRSSAILSGLSKLQSMINKRNVEQVETPEKKPSIYRQYFKDDSEKILGNYVTAVRNLSREKIRNEIRAIDPEYLHAANSIREELRKGNIREAMKILEYQDYLKLSPDFDVNDFQKELEDRKSVV